MVRPDDFEELERRLLLSVTLDHGKLVITGTRRADIIEVYIDSLTNSNAFVVRDNGARYRFDPADVKRIFVNTGQGNDSINFRQSGLPGAELYPVHVPSTVRGGAGNDSFNCSAANSLLDGGDGNDQLSGGIGNDTLLGGKGDDFLDSFDGNDLLRGGDGRDTLNGGYGNDHLQGDGGNDSLIGAQGNDLLEGGPGSDVLIGADGIDRVFGNRGTDTFDSTDRRSQRKDMQDGEMVVDRPPVDPFYELA